MPRAKVVQVRMAENLLRIVELLQEKLGIETRAGLIKHAIARLAIEHNVKLRGKSSAK